MQGELERPELLSSLRLCPACQIAMARYTGPACIRCGFPTPERICHDCRDDPPPWSGVAWHGLYAGALREAILQLKFGRRLHLASLFGDLLYQAAACLPGPDLLAAVPQYPKSLRRRGFNQAHEIARRLATLSGFPLASDLLYRTRGGIPQERLGAKERKRNVAGAFRASAKAQNRTIWLVDDVLTTGSTCHAATQSLLEAGAARVFLVFVARTGLK